MSLTTTNLAVEVLRPGDDGYDAAARVFYSTGRPALVVRPRDPDEIAAALTYAVRHDLAVAVRSGGHSPLGHGSNAGGMVIDLAHLDDVDVLDAGRRLVRVGGGATWGRVAAALDPYGWALTAGDTASVGVGGLTLGGGIGWMVRKHGLAIDNLVGAGVVTADGRLLTTSPDEHPDLFWALRGGGGNFGVVVDFDFLAQPVGTVHFGSVTYRLDDSADLLARWRDAMRVAPEELSSTLALTPRMPGAPPSATVLLCYAGEPGTKGLEADAAIEPLLGLGTVTAARISERRYVDILEDAAPPRGLRLAGPQYPGADPRRRCGGGDRPPARRHHRPDSDRCARSRWGVQPGACGCNGVRPPSRGGDGRRVADASRHGNRCRGRASARALARRGGPRRRPVRQLPGLSDGRGPGGGLPARDVRPPGRSQARLRPRQPVRAQSQRRAGSVSGPQPSGLTRPRGMIERDCKA